MYTSSKRVATRVIADIILLGGVLLLPWWAALSLSVVLFFAFENFVEMLIAALLMDLIYAAPTPRFFGFEFVLSLVSIMLYIVSGFLKRRMRF